MATLLSAESRNVSSLAFSPPEPARPITTLFGVRAAILQHVKVAPLNNRSAEVSSNVSRTNAWTPECQESKSASRRLVSL
jgi:hypothetical protein